MSEAATRTYIVHMACTNCDWSGNRQIPFGRPVPPRMTCPKCGCDALIKRYDPTPTLGVPSVAPIQPGSWPTITPWQPRPWHPLPTPPWRMRERTYWCTTGGTSDPELSFALSTG